MTPLLVAYRDGFDTTAKPVPWTMATPSTMVTFMAHEAYSVAVVCAVDATTVLTWQTLRTVGDDATDKAPEPTLNTPCEAAGPTLRVITGTAAGPGFVHLDGENAGSPTSTSTNWPFTLHAVDGKYDLVVSDTTAKKALITRNFMVNGDAAGVTASAATGSALVMITPSLANPPSAKGTEKVTAQIEVQTANNSGPATLFTAPFELDTKVNKDQVVTLFALPDAALTKDDTQSVRFTGTNDIADTNMHTKRSVTMPFAMGDDVTKGAAAAALPGRLATATVSPGWGLDNNRLSVALPSLPALDDMTIETSGKSATDANKTAMYELHITAGYFQATTLARALLDTSMPGFQAAWKIDFTKQYSRQITTQHDTFDDDGNFVDHETSQFLEDVNLPPPPP